VIDPAEANRACFESGAWARTTYRGVPVFKYPEDLWTYQEIIHEVQPTVIVETGTAWGGSALYFQDLLDRLPWLPKQRRVITVDTLQLVKEPHTRIIYVRGSSTEPSTRSWVTDYIRADDVVLVSLDSEHLEEHVYEELGLFAGLVTVGSYLVVEDTFISLYDCHGDRFRDGSTWEALERWLPEHGEFERDVSRDKFMLSMNPGGWLRRIA